MELITGIRIEGFRSIEELELEGFRSFNAFCGLNNSGKSNVLRAINTFFTSHCEPGVALDINRDFHQQSAKQHRKKEIAISVTFNIPSNFRFRKGLEGVNDLIKSGTTITKVWDRSYIMQYYLNDDELGFEDVQRVEQFLSLITFRYVPNRVLPVDVIEQQHSALRDALVRRLGKKAPSPKKLFGAIESTSTSLLQSMEEHVKRICPGIEGVLLKTPDNWANIVFALGYKLRDFGIDIDNAYQGSGIQSLLMFETLALIDRDFFQQFGWRQAALWVVEEPESSLHTSLEAQLATYLSEIANETEGRLQIFATTHSDMMLQYADSAIFLEKGDNGTISREAENKKEVISMSASAGISRWIHPILFSPLDTVILVEGKFDYDFLREVFQLIKPKKKIVLRTLAQLDGNQDYGGVDKLYEYIKANRNAIKSRNASAPVIVLLDWDSASKEKQFEKLFSKSDSCIIVAWPESAFNPKLGESFHGIERHFSDRIIREAEKLGVGVARDADGVGVIEKSKYGAFKKQCNEVVRRGLNNSDISHCRAFIEEILAKLSD